MSNREYDVPIEGHDYDGIEELNNPLPRWWLATFYGAIIFAIIYYGYFQLGPGPSHDETLARRMESVRSAQAAAKEAMTAGDASIDVAALMADEEAMELGRKKFAEICALCHGKAGQGSIGPNLTDQYWIHSKGEITGILAAIRAGFPEKGMPPWGAVIPEDEQAPLAAYVISLQGSDPADAKAPEGEYVPRQ
jgi:cytochrome c oxidase cbb3-type subunit 3